MKLNRTGWLSLVLVFMLLFSSVQAGASSAYATVPKGSASISKGELRSLSSLEGIVKVVQGNKITYRSSSAISAPVKRLKQGSLTAKVSVTGISLDWMDRQMGLDDSWNPYSVDQPLLITLKPSSDLYWVTTDDLDNGDIIVSVPKVFELVYDSNGKIYLEAVKTGGGAVTVRLNGGPQASKSFSISKKVLFSSMTIGELTGSSPADYECVTLKSKTMYPGESSIVLAQPKPYTATYYDSPYYDWYDYSTSAVNFTSSNPKVATIGSYGRVVAGIPGKTTITATARDGSKKKYSFTLTVEPYPLDSFTLTEAGPLVMSPGTTHQLSVDFLPVDYYDTGVIWTSSDPSVAKVDENGLVTAVSPYPSKKGKSNTVIITAQSTTGLAADIISITVSYDKNASGAPYRFYGIGNSDYGDADTNLPACADDVELMAAAYTDSGLVLNTDAYVYHSQTGNEMRGILQDMVDNTSIDTNDVTVFYYSGHGTDARSQAYRGALCGADILTASDDSCYVTVDDVQSYLDQVPGTVVVIMDSCLSGQFITAKSVTSGKKQAAVRAFNSAWISQLSKSKATNFTAKALTSSAFSSKYKILTASEALELSWGGGANSFGWFTYWAGLGLGRVANFTNGSSASGSLLADANKDNAVTLQELYKYVSTNVAKEFDPVTQQHTQVWPANDNFAVLVK